MTIRLWNEISLICFTLRLGWIFESNRRLDRIGGGQSDKLNPTWPDESLRVRRDFECLALSQVNPRVTSRFAVPVIQKYLVTTWWPPSRGFYYNYLNAFPFYSVVIRVIPNTCWPDRLEGKSADRKIIIIIVGLVVALEREAAFFFPSVVRFHALTRCDSSSPLSWWYSVLLLSV